MCPRLCAIHKSIYFAAISNDMIADWVKYPELCHIENCYEKGV